MRTVRKYEPGTENTTARENAKQFSNFRRRLARKRKQNTGYLAFHGREFKRDFDRSQRITEIGVKAFVKHALLVPK